MSDLTVAEVLERAADLIEPEGAWTTDASARNQSGESVSVRNPDAVCFCALGAILRFGGGAMNADDYFGNFLQDRQNWLAIGHWNDAPGRTQAEVVPKLREAAAIARARGEG